MSSHTQTNGPGKPATYTPVIVKRETKSESYEMYKRLENKVEDIDQYHAFATAVSKIEQTEIHYVDHIFKYLGMRHCGL